MTPLKIMLPLLFLANTLLAQTEPLALSINNPQPRVGERFTVSFALDFINEDISEQLERNPAFKLGEPSFTNRAYSRTFTAKEAGNHTIGPIELTLDGKTYTTNTLALEVIAPLARQEGLWLRHVQLGEEEFLILEQYIQDQKSTYSTAAFDQGEEPLYEKPFTSLQEQLAEGITLRCQYSLSTANDGKSEPGAPSLGYCLRVYRIEKAETFSGSLVLSDQHFQHLPPHTSLPFLVLR